ncbi:Sarcoplasmic calcium-binding protein [Geodia barretti]|uniref:Sarcoplasmic calcium-binding protein n=1 Tax=Geodia barretti TaxID=519541 RepID=A0AA35TVV4_GEOBA|nr:Sarcoplasmic calcium-binding protein [Geodia barretti]
MATGADYLGNAAWVKRMEQLFDSYDLDKNGQITKDEFHTSINKLSQKVTDRPELIEKLRKSTVELTDALGLGDGVKADRKKFVELLAAFVVGEKAKTLIEKHNVALFDVVDGNNDGNLTWDEYKSVMEVSGFDEATAKAAFDTLDKNKNGKIDRKELASADLKFWTGLD